MINSATRRASKPQRDFIDALVLKCEERKIEVPEVILEEIRDEDLTMSRASEIIDELKFELGWSD